MLGRSVAVGAGGHERGSVQPDPNVYRGWHEVGPSGGDSGGGGEGSDQLARLHAEQLRGSAGARRDHAGVWHGGGEGGSGTTEVVMVDIFLMRKNACLRFFKWKWCCCFCCCFVQERCCGNGVFVAVLFKNDVKS